jgi:hypothetical protein
LVFAQRSVVAAHLSLALGWAQASVSRLKLALSQQTTQVHHHFPMLPMLKQLVICRWTKRLFARMKGSNVLVLQAMGIGMTLLVRERDHFITTYPPTTDRDHDVHPMASPWSCQTTAWSFAT